MSKTLRSINLFEPQRVFVAGCGGMLGAALHQKLVQDGCTVMATDLVADRPWLAHCDVRNHDDCKRQIEEFAPDLVLNLAAMTDLEECETDTDRTWATNAYGAQNLAKISAGIGCKHVYISTAGVFDGRKESYTEDDAAIPLSVYGKSKYWAEAAVLDAHPITHVIRAGWMMGGGPEIDHKFVSKVFRQLVAGKRHLHVVTDKHGSPTWTEEFVNGMALIIKSAPGGLYHQTCPGKASRLDVAKAFIHLLGMDDQVTITPVTSDFFSGEYFANRPLSEQLVNARLQALGLDSMRDWRICLDEYSAQYRSRLA